MLKEPEQLSITSLFNDFAQMGNQLKRMRNIESILNWKPLYAEDAKAEVYPGILEFETTPFRHGPPGCEDVLRSLYFQMTTTTLSYMVEAIEKESVKE